MKSKKNKVMKTKKNKLFWMSFVLMLAFGMSSCSSDDEPTRGLDSGCLEIPEVEDMARFFTTNSTMSSFMSPMTPFSLGQSLGLTMTPISHQTMPRGCSLSMIVIMGTGVTLAGMSM